MREICEDRFFIAFTLSVAIGSALLRLFPFPATNNVLQSVLLHRPYLFYVARYSFTVMLFTTPFIFLSVLLSLLYIFVLSEQRALQQLGLPEYPDPETRDQLFLVIGELHHPRKAEPTPNPQWLIIPEKGLYTGIAVFGAIGSGKTSGCIYPFAEQLLAYQCHGESSSKVAGLALEVKGEFCHKLRQILSRHGRDEDYVEVALDSEYRYNPLQNDLEAYALAYGIASLLNNLFGRGKEPFWQQAYTNLVKFIILLHKVLYDYVTLFDVYECAINPQKLEVRIAEGELLFGVADYVLIDDAAYISHAELAPFPWERVEGTNWLRAPAREELRRLLNARQIIYDIEMESTVSNEIDPLLRDKRERFEAVKRWFTDDWRRIEPKLRTSIVEGISVFLSLFDDNPAVKRTFCPPKQCYDPKLNRDGRYGKPLPPFRELVEEGKICALNFPVAANPGLARAIGTMLKQDFQRAMLARIPDIEQHPERAWRAAVFLCDEYQSFATTGESDPTGDEKFFALSRQAKCIPIVATQSISSLRSTLPAESWRTLLQTFRTRVFLTLSDDFSARIASELCGKQEQLKLNYSISENGQDARVSMLTGTATAHRASLSTSKSYSVQRDWVFEPKAFTELKNAQSIVLAYDGLNPIPPTYCYLKPHYLDPNDTYFEQLAKGEI